LIEAAVKLRRRSWQGRVGALEAEGGGRFGTAVVAPGEGAAQGELPGALPQGIEEGLAADQRRVLVGLALKEGPAAVLAERLRPPRGALYKTLHDARRKLRKHLEDSGLALAVWLGEEER